MSWFRAARRIAGLAPQAEYPSLEALLETEIGQPHSGFFYAARIVPPIGVLIGTAVFIPLALNISPLFYIGTAGFCALAAFFGILFNFLDRSITPAKKKIRKISNELWSRYGIGNLVGVEPVISPNVGPVLDEAASIYLKHAPTGRRQRFQANDAYSRAQMALEVAMARMMDLAAAKNTQSQELELQSGWALPLLKEMRQMDAAMTNVSRYAQDGVLRVDPLANLADARAELTGVVSALEELEQRQTS